MFPTGHRNELIPLNDSSWSFFPSLRSNENTQRKPVERQIALCLDDKSMRWGLAPENFKNKWTAVSCSLCCTKHMASLFCNIARIFRGEATLYIDEHNKICEVATFAVYSSDEGEGPIYMTASKTQCCLCGLCSCLCGSCKSDYQLSIGPQSSSCWVRMQEWIGHCSQTPFLKGCRATNIWCAVIINAVVTALTVATASALHNNEEVKDGGSWLQYVLPGIIYMLVGFAMYILIGFGGGSISSTPKMILTKKASLKFMDTITDPTKDNKEKHKENEEKLKDKGVLCLECDNSVVMPSQRLYLAYFVRGFAKPMSA